MIDSGNMGQALWYVRVKPAFTNSAYGSTYGYKISSMELFPLKYYLPHPSSINTKCVLAFIPCRIHYHDKHVLIGSKVKALHRPPVNSPSTFIRVEAYAKLVRKEEGPQSAKISTDLFLCKKEVLTGCALPTVGSLW